MEKIDASIIIVSWNTKDILHDCLKSVYAQTRNTRLEVIVVDNASTDDSVEMVKTEFPDVILIENPENMGFSVANNQGMALSKGRYVLLLNSDTIVLENSIDKTVSFADSHPDTAVVGCRILNPDMTLQPSCFKFPSLLNQILFVTYMYKLFPHSHFWGRERLTWWGYNDVRDVDVISGCFMLVRQEAIKQVGMLDTRFFMYAEEVDWCCRFRRAGWKIQFTPCAQIIHYGGISAANYGNKRAIIKDASVIKLMFKHWPGWKAYFGVFLMILFYLSRLLFICPISLIKPSKARLDLLHNHITGLKGLLRFRQYLDKQTT